MKYLYLILLIILLISAWGKVYGIGYDFTPQYVNPAQHVFTFSEEEVKHILLNVIKTNHPEIRIKKVNIYGLDNRSYLRPVEVTIDIDEELKK